MYADLNLRWPAELPASAAAAQITKTLTLAETLGYAIAALTVKASTTADLRKVLERSFTPGVFAQLEAAHPKIKLLRRVTIVLSDTSTQPQQFAAVVLATGEEVRFDLVAAEPQTERQLLACATNLDIDLISVDGSQRLSYPLRHRPCGAAVARGVRFELLYSHCFEAHTQRHLIANAMLLFRACRNRGVVLSSGASIPKHLRAPLDVANLAKLWGLPANAARDAVADGAVAAATQGVLRRMGAKQAVIPNKRVSNDEPKNAKRQRRQPQPQKQPTRS